MNTEKFNLLKEIYAKDKNLVMIADEKWNVIWSNQKTDIINISNTLGLLPDDWKTDKITQPEEGIRYTFRYLKQDGIRIVSQEIDPLKLVFPVMNVLTSAVQTEALNCRAIYRMMEELPEGDDLSLLGSFSGNCYRMYRLAHILREIYEIESNITEDMCFSLNAQLEEISENLELLYRRYISLECEFGEKKIFVNMEKGAFVSAILAGICVALLAPDKYQRIRIELNEEKDIAVIQITVEPEMGDEQPDRRLQIKDLEVIANDKEYLQCFCKKYQCQWDLQTEGNNAVFSLRIPISEQKKVLSMNLNSLNDDNNFIAYTAMLSILHHRTII